MEYAWFHSWNHLFCSREIFISLNPKKTLYTVKIMASYITNQEQLTLKKQVNMLCHITTYLYAGQ